MAKREIVTGTLIDDHTVALDKPLSLKSMKVRVAIEPLDEKQPQGYRPEIIAKIYAAQAARGYRPPSREEVDQRIEAERNSWGD